MAVAAGGTAALSACLGSDGDDASSVDVPSGTDEPESLPTRQHAWNDALTTDEHGTVQPPAHHVLVALSLQDNVVEDGRVDNSARETTETALRALERAYEWSNEGLVFTLGYTPAYFDRFDESLPELVDLPEPEALTGQESPDFDDFDAVFHLASDSPEVVIEAEEGLFGEVETLNGVDPELETDLSAVFDRLEDQRRTGFVGDGLPADHTDTDGVPESVPEDAPFFMGFRSGFQESQATEDRVTLESGPFAGGATQHVESMDINLTQWFNQENHFQRVSKMFSHEHATEDLVGDVGETLTGSSELRDERIDSTAADARSHNVVGHAQKAARAREDGEPLLLRRDFNTVDSGGPGLHFVSLQHDIDEFVRVREAMTGADLDVPMANNGIRHYIFVTRRGNYLVPPRPLRALPPADPDAT
nr:Tat pathway signal protein [Natronolimnobius sp. AArcel1]